MSTDKDWRERLLRELRDESAWRDALARLAEIAEDEIPSRIDATVASTLVLLLGDPSRTRQRLTADVCARLAPHAPVLRQALESALGALDPRLRWGAAYTLGHVPGALGARLWPPVRETLALEDGDQRWAAAELTCALAAQDGAVRDDVRMAVATGSPTMRRMLLYCLRDLQDPELLTHAGPRLDDEDPGVRLAALAAIAGADRPGNDAAPTLLRITRLVDEDPDAGVRRAAAATLGKLGAATSDVLAALDRAARSGDPSLARAATAAQTRLGAPARDPGAN